MDCLSMIIRLLTCFVMGMCIGSILCCIYEFIKVIKKWRSKPKEPEYNAYDYGKAELLMKKYEDRAIEVYKILDPDKRLITGGCTYQFSFMPRTFEKGVEPKMMVNLKIDWREFSDGYIHEVWFPFDFMNCDYLSSYNADDKIVIEWDKKEYSTGTGGIWKMIADWKEDK